VQVFAGDELMLISNHGTLVRTRADEVSIVGRNTQGVRVIRTKEGESLVGIQRIDEPVAVPGEPAVQGELIVESVLIVESELTVVSEVTDDSETEPQSETDIDPDATT